MQGSVEDVLAAAEPWPHVRPVRIEDLPWLAEASWDASPHRAPVATWDAQVEQQQAIFRSEAGELMPVASPVAITDDDFIAGAVVTVLRPTDDGLPDCPFVLDCVTLPDHRRQGVASGLLASAARAAKAVGETHLAIGVDADNADALAFLDTLGFEETMRGPAPS